MAANTFSSPSDLGLWLSELNRKCRDMTPPCGETVAVLADDTIAKSRSPDLTSCRSCGSCPQLRAWILIDEHRSFAQAFELGREDIVSDAVAGIELLIVGEAIVLGLLRSCAGRKSKTCEPRYGRHGSDADIAH
jgi:hypothetical protein